MSVYTFQLAAPTKTEIRAKVPQTHDDNRDEIRYIDVKVHLIYLHIKQQDAANHAGNTNCMKLTESPQNREELFTGISDGAKGPKVVPNKIVYDSELCSNGFA
jgi:hypothetical protein